MLTNKSDPHAIKVFDPPVEGETDRSPIGSEALAGACGGECDLNGEARLSPLEL